MRRIAGKAIQHALGRLRQLLRQFGIARRSNLRRIALRGLLALLRLEQGAAQPAKFIQPAIGIGRHAQIAPVLRGLFAHAKQVLRHAFGGAADLHRPHVVVKFRGLPRRIAQLVAKTWTNVLPGLLRLRVVRHASWLTQQLHQAAGRTLAGRGIGLTHRLRGHGACYPHGLHLHHLQAIDFQCARLLAIRQLDVAAHLALHHPRAGIGRHGHGAQRQAGAAIFKPALVQRYAAVVQRPVHLNARGQRGAAGLVVQHHIAGKQAGRAVGVVLDVKAQQLDGKRQVLYHHAVLHGNNGRIVAAAFGHRQMAAKARRIRPQPMLRGYLRHPPRALIRRFALHRHLRPQQPVAIHQAAQANQHHRAMPGQIADAIQPPLARGHHPAAALRQRALLQPHLPALIGQLLPQRLRSRLRRMRQHCPPLEAQRLQGRHGDIFFAVAPVAHNGRHVARHAGTGAGDQKSQHQDVPRALVNMEKTQRLEHIRPKRAIQPRIRAVGLLLGQQRANDRGQRNYQQQGDGKAHGGQQPPRCPQQARAQRT